MWEEFQRQMRRGRTGGGQSAEGPVGLLSLSDMGNCPWDHRWPQMVTSAVPQENHVITMALPLCATEQLLQCGLAV